MPPEENNTNPKLGNPRIPLIKFIEDFTTINTYKPTLTKKTDDGFEYNRYFMITYNWMKELSGILAEHHKTNKPHNDVSPLTLYVSSDLESIELDEEYRGINEEDYQIIKNQYEIKLQNRVKKQKIKIKQKREEVDETINQQPLEVPDEIIKDNLAFGIIAFILGFIGPKDNGIAKTWEDVKKLDIEKVSLANFNHSLVLKYAIKLYDEAEIDSMEQINKILVERQLECTYNIEGRNLPIYGRARFDKQKKPVDDPLVGSGTFGVVYIIEDEKNELKDIVIKELKKTNIFVDIYFGREILSNKEDSNQRPSALIQAYAFCVKSHCITGIIFENGGENLVKFLDRISFLVEGQLIELARDISEALEYLHSKGIMHRDVKPQNILVKDKKTNLIFDDTKIMYIENLPWKVTLADYGECRRIEKTVTAERGTDHYRAPEMYDRNSKIIDGVIQIQYDKKVDSYGFGMMLYFAMTKKDPFGDFQSMKNRKLYKYPADNDEGGISWVVYKGLDQYLYSTKDRIFREKGGKGPELLLPKGAGFDSIKLIILKCSEFDPKNRPTMKEIVDYFKNLRNS